MQFTVLTQLALATLACAAAITPDSKFDDLAGKPYTNGNHPHTSGDIDHDGGGNADNAGNSTSVTASNAATRGVHLTYPLVAAAFMVLI